MHFATHTDFSSRMSPRELPELMDGDCSYEDFRDCLLSLEQINRWSLGYRPTLSWLEKLPRDRGEALRIVDVGSGGGDLLRKIAAWAQKNDIAVHLTGIDLNPYATRAAIEFNSVDSQVTFLTEDALNYSPDQPVDIVVSSLMVHHLEDEDAITFLRWMESTARIGWFVNDLKRSKSTSRLFRLAARLFGWHRFVHHDGPVSFLRAFRAADWERLLSLAKVPEGATTLRSWFPGRMCVGRWKTDERKHLGKR